MQLVRRNIWLIFYLLIIGSFGLVVTLAVREWQAMERSYQQRQDGLVSQWFTSFSSILEQQEAIITLAGEDILLHNKVPKSAIENRLNALMALNPEFFSGFAIISPSGDILNVTANLDRPDKPNLTQLPETKDSFQLALEAKSMVLGRTYEAPRLVIPARKAIRNEEGEVLGVMTGAIRVKGSEGFFSHSNVMGPFQRITVLRNRDNYVLFATNGELIPDFERQPIEDEAFKKLREPTQGAGAETESPSGIIRFERKTDDGRGELLGVAKYNSRYDFWMISEIEKSHLEGDFLKL